MTKKGAYWHTARGKVSKLLDGSNAAAMAGIAPSTWQSYCSRGYAPPPIWRFGNQPVWTEDQVNVWMMNRRGQGARGGRPRKDSR